LAPRIRGRHDGAVAKARGKDRDEAVRKAFKEADWKATRKLGDEKLVDEDEGLIDEDEDDK
jgi:hypothetical protein